MPILEDKDMQVVRNALGDKLFDNAKSEAIALIGREPTPLGVLLAALAQVQRRVADIEMRLTSVKSEPDMDEKRQSFIETLAGKRAELGNVEVYQAQTPFPHVLVKTQWPPSKELQQQLRGMIAAPFAILYETLPPKEEVLDGPKREG